MVLYQSLGYGVQMVQAVALVHATIQHYRDPAHLQDVSVGYLAIFSGGEETLELDVRGSFNLHLLMI